MRKNILITGGTGFLGKALCQQLLSIGCNLYVLTRRHELLSQPLKPVFDQSFRQYFSALSQISSDFNIHGVINLAGESLVAKRWSKRQKDIIESSRYDITNALSEWSKSLESPLEFFMSSSAIGWYGHRGQEELKEDSEPGSGFAAQLCHHWEQLSERANAHRVIKLRTGVVLEKDGGPLKEMLLPFSLGVGGPMGSGEQVWSWIHRTDWISAVIFLIGKPELNGAFNLTAPVPETQKEFAYQLGKALSRPAFIKMPGFMASLMLGEFAEEVLLNGQRVIPNRLLNQGFEFQYPNLELALKSIFSSKE